LTLPVAACDRLPMEIPILSGLSEIAHTYDALICDVWGVLHNGHEAYTAADRKSVV